MKKWTFVLLVLALVLAVLAREDIDRAVRWLRGDVLPQPGPPTLESVSGVQNDVMAIEEGPDGLWVTSKYAVTFYPQGDPARPAVVLDPQRFADRFGGRMNALSTAALAPDGTLWVGSWYGEVFVYANGLWRRLASEAVEPWGKIEAILPLDGEVFVAGAGLWRWRSPEEDPVAEEAFRGRPVHALAADDAGRLLAGASDGVDVRDDGRWRRLFAVAAGDREVTALLVRRDGTILAGTHDGLVRLDAAGRTLARELAGSWITELVDDGGRLWVGTWEQGLFLETDSGWKKLGFTEGLPDDAIYDMTLDTRGRLWLGIYGEGLYVADRSELARFVEAVDPPPPDARARFFDDACRAAEAMDLGDGGSGGVARETSPRGRTLVFFGGRRVCPRGPGFRAAPGRFVLVEDGGLWRADGGPAVRVALPAGLGPRAVTTIFVDRRGRLWLGTRGDGLFVDEGAGFVAVGADGQITGSFVAAIAEDADGRIWVGTSPAFDAARGRHVAAGLHRFDGASWAHFEPSRPRVTLERGLRSGLASATTNDVVVLADGRVAVGTNGGLSIYDGTDFRTYDAGFPGLASGYVAWIAEDDDGRLWLAHALWGNGVSWLDGGVAAHRDSPDGLFADEIGAVAVDGKGRVWLATSSGRVGIYPREAF